MVVHALVLLAVASALACDEPSVPGDLDVPVHVDLVAIDSHDLPVVVLEEDGGSRSLPIWIGHSEAHSIAVEMKNEPSLRPNTHDLAKRIIHGLEGEVVRVVVTELRGGTYFAEMTLRHGRKTVELDARPSDAIAIALRAKVPIYVRSSLLEEKPPAPEPASRGQRI